MPSRSVMVGAWTLPRGHSLITAMRDSIDRQQRSVQVGRNGLHTTRAFARKLAKLRGDFCHDLAALAGISGIPTERLAVLERAAAEPTLRLSVPIL